MVTYKIKNNLLIIFASLLVLVATSVILFIFIFKNESKIIEAEENRYKLYLRADQLRQTSDDLTRMARLYVVTGDSKYKEYFQTILDIREGLSPRPENYHSIYWDFYIATGEPPRTSGQPISLQELIRQEGFTERELFFLQETEKISNDLAKIEEQAMNLISGLYKDRNGNYTIKGHPDPEKARQLLHDTEYNRIKEQIMRPLDKFFGLVEKRTTDTIENYRKIGERLSILLTIILIIVFCLLFVSFIIVVFSFQKSKEEQFGKLSFLIFFRSHFFKHWPFVAAAVVIVSLTIGTSWWNFTESKVLIYNNLSNHLDQTLQTSYNTTLDWISKTKLEALLLSQTIDYRISESSFQDIQKNKFDSFQSELAESNILSSEISKKYILLNSKDIIADSDHKALVGRVLKIPQSIQQQMNRPPYQTVHFISKDSPFLPIQTVLFGTRLSQERGTIFFLLDSEMILSQLLKRHFFYGTDEIYIVNVNGQFISQSRWIQTIMEKGFILDDSMAGLKVSQDPLNHQSLLSLPVREVIKGRKGINLEGYRNYLNEHVVGQWMWDPVYKFGIIAEWKTNEALAMFTNYKNQIISETSFIVLLILILTVFFIWKNIEISKTNSQLTDAYTTIAKQNEKYANDLQIGQKVQMDMLPETIRGDKFAIDAILKPAQIVSGDFYDFSFIDKKDQSKIYFSIGDVSGKGVPAALLMAATKAFLHKTLDQVQDSKDIVDKVNQELAEGNERCMFVTLIVGIMDVRTGYTQITNAGHNPPYIKKRTGEVICLSENQGPVVGTFKDVKYSVQSFQMLKGDILLFYTDGVVEAQNKKQEFYGETRIQDFLKQNTFIFPQYLTNSLSENVVSFIGGSQQSDDITILSLGYLG